MTRRGGNLILSLTDGQPFSSFCGDQVSSGIKITNLLIFVLYHYQDMQDVLSEVDIEEEGMPWEGQVGLLGEKMNIKTILIYGAGIFYSSNKVEAAFVLQRIKTSVAGGLDDQTWRGRSVSRRQYLPGEVL